MASTISTVVDAGPLLGDLQPDARATSPWCRASQRSHAFADANSSTGRSGTCSATGDATPGVATSTRRVTMATCSGAEAGRRAPLALPRPAAHRAAHVHRGRRELRRRAARRATTTCATAPTSASATTSGTRAQRRHPRLGRAPRRRHDGRAGRRADRRGHDRRGAHVTRAAARAVGVSHRARRRRARPLRVRVRHAARRTPRRARSASSATRDAGDGTVRFDVVAFSRPHDLLTKLGGPVPRRIQARRREQYLAGHARPTSPPERASRSAVTCVREPRDVRGGGRYFALSASMSLGTTLCTSPTMPRSAMPKIGASPSLLTQMMLSEPFMPTMCWVAPEMPSAM